MHSSVNNLQDVTSALQVLLAKYFGQFPNEAMQNVASHSLEKLLVECLTLEKNPGSWAGGLIYALNKYAILNQHVVLNSELEEIFGAKMGSIRNRAEEIWPIIEPIVLSLSGNRPERVFTLRDEANAMCAYAFRNGFIEEIHSSVTSDGSPRITDPEMKRLMIDASIKLAKLLEMKADNPEKYHTFMKDYGQNYCYNWER